MEAKTNLNRGAVANESKAFLECKGGKELRISGTGEVWRPRRDEAAAERVGKKGSFNYVVFGGFGGFLFFL